MTERQRIQNNERAKAWFQTHKNDPKLKVRRKKYDEKYYLKNKEKIAEKNANIMKKIKIKLIHKKEHVENY